MNVATCVQCLNHMEFAVDEDSFKGLVFVCTNPKCPNYGLLAICVEKMPEETLIDKYNYVEKYGYSKVKTGSV